MGFFLGFLTACLPPMVEHTFMVDPAIEWVADEEDIICGLTDLRMIQNPGVVDWTALMDATSEMKKIKKEGIEKDSPRGIVLITRAESKCRTACFKQMRKTKVDSIWKAISHPKKLPWDQTQAVIAIINNEKKKEVLFRWKAKGAITP